MNKLEAGGRDPAPDPDEQQLLDDLSTLYTVSVPTVDLRLTEAERTARGAGFVALLGSPWTRRAGLGVAAAVLAAALFLSRALLGGDGATPVDAGSILAQSEAAAAGRSAALTDYHLVGVETTGRDMGKATSWTTEVWYLDGTHLRVEQRDGDPGANGTIAFGQAVSGDEAWWYSAESGSLRVAHGPSLELGAALQANVGGGTSLADIVASYSGGCSLATVDGETEVERRDAYLLTVHPDAASCESDAERAKLAATPAEALGQLRLWVDKETFVPLRIENVDGRGDVLFEYRVEVFEQRAGLDAAMFRYQAPTGVRAVDVASAAEAKGVIAGVDVGGAPPDDPCAKPATTTDQEKCASQANSSN